MQPFFRSTLFVSLIFATLIAALITVITTPWQVAHAQQSTNQGANITQSFDQTLANIFNDQPDFLPVDQAFVFNFRQKNDKLLLIWDIADGYYIYKDKFEYAIKGAEMGEAQYPPSRTITDEFFGKSDVYFNQVVITVPINNVSSAVAELKVRFQGCAEAGFCYPPEKQVVPIEKITATPTVSTLESNKVNLESNNKPQLAEHAELADKLANSNLLGTLLIFFILGIGLALTPCVFPMYPILSSIIVGQGQQLSLARAFSLSMAYVQGMAITYAGLGLVVASLGVQFQAYFQHPAVLISISFLFVLLALAMFGVYDLSLPEKWQSKLTGISNKQKSGNVASVFAMGALSGLIASPCTTAPLSGALLFVAQSGDLVVGGLTLYILSLGMGVPLLIIGTTGGKILPKAGNWMNTIKHIFGFILLAVPLILLERIMPFNIVMVFALLLALALAAYLHHVQSGLTQSKTKTGVWLVSIILVVFSTTQLLNNQPLFGSTSTVGTSSSSQSNQTSSAMNSTDNSQDKTDAAHGDIQFIKIKTVNDLNQQLATAVQNGEYVMLDLYADWCVACKEFEKFTFSDINVQQSMKSMRLLHADVTKNDDDDIVLMESYMVFGLPTILFFSPDGKEVTSHRVTGFKGAKEFHAHLQSLKSIY
ncbi:protein-disulfide reductase DsbD [Flocculibacter collagenilyticus]|uniref:protein-disulfide reductase DsbD n=1 Tax=Flocculibacter collagenilyticus TaxID=2744479 RepID=UPI0018F3DDCF|nr:protein-disulfide reductase DsbD [Flocculibacter collagenilyticus]